MGDLRWSASLRAEPYFITMIKPNIFLAFAVMIGSIFLISNSNYSNDTQSKIKFDIEVKYQYTFYFDNQFANYNVKQSNEATKTEFKISGVCTSKNFDDFDLMMSHVTCKSQFVESARIGESTFHMTKDDSHQIFGAYEGYYGGAKDRLKAICRSDPANTNVRILKLKGTILRHA